MSDPKGVNSVGTTPQPTRNPQSTKKSESAKTSHSIFNRDKTDSGIPEMPPPIDSSEWDNMRIDPGPPPSPYTKERDVHSEYIPGREPSVDDVLNDATKGYAKHEHIEKPATEENNVSTITDSYYSKDGKLLAEKNIVDWGLGHTSVDVTTPDADYFDNNADGKIDYKMTDRIVNGFEGSDTDKLFNLAINRKNLENKIKEMEKTSKELRENFLNEF